MRRLTLLLFAAAAFALEAPKGEMPTLDGSLGEGEWAVAATLRSGPAVLHLRRVGRVLCGAIEVRAPYRGERIDLSLASAGGLDYARFSFHPACHLPRGQFLPVAPVLVRHASYATRRDARATAPHSTRFRANVLKRADRWSAEFAVSFTALNLRPDDVSHLLVEILHPFTGEAPLRLTPVRRGVEGPAGWLPLTMAADERGGEFPTPGENALRALEMDLFGEFLDETVGRKARQPILGAAVAPKANARIDALLERFDEGAAIDADDFFLGYTRARLLRLANRLPEAERALDDLAKRFPFASEYPPLQVERYALLATTGRFEEAARLVRVAEVQALAASWAKEQEARRADAQRDDSPRIAFDTTKGRVVLELFGRDRPKAVARVVAFVESGHYAGAEFGPVTGGRGAEVARPGTDDLFVLEVAAREAWRGTLALLPAGNGAFALATGHSYRGQATAVGRVIEGMEFVDALEAGDSIRTAQVVRRGTKR